MVPLGGNVTHIFPRIYICNSCTTILTVFTMYYLTISSDAILSNPLYHYLV